MDFKELMDDDTGVRWQNKNRQVINGVIQQYNDWLMMGKRLILEMELAKSQLSQEYNVMEVMKNDVTNAIN